MVDVIPASNEAQAQEAALLNQYGRMIGVNPTSLGVLKGPLVQTARHAMQSWDAVGVKASDLGVVVSPTSRFGVKVILRNPPEGVPQTLEPGTALTDWAFRQLATTRLRVPAEYALALVQGVKSKTVSEDAHPLAFCALVNSLLVEQAAAGRTFLVRGKGSEIRAVLTNRYSVFDHFDLLAPFARALKSHLEKDTVQVDYFGISDTQFRLGVTLTDERLRTPIPESEKGGTGRFDSHLFGPNGAKSTPTGEADAGGGLVVDAREHGHGGQGGTVTDYYRPCFELSNSEVGDGTTSITPGLWRHYCSNRAIVKKLMWARRHVGHQLSDGAKVVVEQDLRQAIIHVIENVPTIVAAFAAARENPEAEPRERIDIIAQRHNLTDKTRDSLLMAFALEPEATQFGVAQAVTRTAQTCEAEERSSLEALGGYLLTLPAKEYVMVYRSDAKVA